MGEHMVHAVPLLPLAGYVDALRLVACSDGHREKGRYWLYILKLRGHFFVSTIGTTAVAALLWGFRCVPEKYYLRHKAL